MLILSNLFVNCDGCSKKMLCRLCGRTQNISAMLPNKASNEKLQIIYILVSCGT
jgi:hypothetical protein